MFRHLIAAAALSLVPTTAFSAPLVTNGGFEQPAVPNPCCTTTPPDPLPGWTATPNVNVVNGTFSSSPPGTNLAFEGTQYLDLVGQGGTGSIFQDLTTVAGQIYSLTFAYSNNGFTPSSSTSASATVSVGSLFDIITHNTANSSNLNWVLYSNTFIASGPTTRLTFTNIAGGVNEGVLLDAIAVGVPEPSTWMMMLLGFGAIGFAMRRRRTPALAQLA